MSNTVFSYAQAAKRHTASQPSPQTAPNVTPAAVVNSQPKDEVISTSNSSISAPSIASNDIDSRDSGSVSQPATDPGVSKPDDVGSTVSAGHSVKGARENDVAAVQSPHFHDDKVSRSTSRTSRSNDSGDGKKGRKNKQGRGSEHDGEDDQEGDQEKEKPVERAKPVYVEASLPLQNVWQQRKEAQAAKAKPAAAPTSSAGQGVSSAATSAATESRVSQSNEDTAVPARMNGGMGEEKAHRKPADSAQAADDLRKNGPRGRSGGKDDKASVPSPVITDVSSFPDLKAATVNGEMSRRPQEKAADRGEAPTQDEANTTKRQKEKWVHMDFVPTAVFATPMPARNPKPRGGARGGRDAGSTRGGHHAPPSATTPPSAGAGAPGAAGAAGASGAAGTTSAGASGEKAASASGAPVAKAADPRPGKTALMCVHRWLPQMELSASLSMLVSPEISGGRQ